MISFDWLRTRVACCLVVLLGAPMANAAATPPLEEFCGQEVQSASSALDQSQRPDGQTDQASTGTPQSQAPDQSGQSSTTQSTPGQEKKDSKPVGTAAAPYEKTTGVAASRPAGAVIAPAKQKRARSILIRVSIIVGAAVAVGTVAALSHASPSKP